MESTLGVLFHPDYKEFLLKASDIIFGCLEPAIITNPQSHRYLPKIVKSARQYGIPDGQEIRDGACKYA